MDADLDTLATALYARIDDTLKEHPVVFDRLIFELPWRQRIGELWTRQLPEPRLTSRWASNQGPEPLPILATMRRALSVRYVRAFDSIGFNCYRRGADSLGWHGDRCREAVVDQVVAIVSIGAPRPFRLRPPEAGDRSRSTSATATSS